MNTEHHYWSIDKLITNINKIEFPEFQREPTVWKLDKKQRLIDSILRDFDISSIYFHKKDDGGYDCIDGRQRINAILSFMGINGSDPDHNGFHLRIENEIYDDEGYFNDTDTLKWDRIKEIDKWKDSILKYRLNIVFISNVDHDEELNLLFLRLQIASVLNAGEKLNAMIGEMRDEIFHNFSKHEYFRRLSIPDRRFAKEQVAAQIIINAFSKENYDAFHRSRFIDLQNFFKDNNILSEARKQLLDMIRSNLDIITNHFKEKLKYIRNRAIAVSVYLFVSDMIKSGKEGEIDSFIDFFVKFLKTLKWQVPQGVRMHEAYYDLMNFQTNISQAAGEKYAIQNRHNFIGDYFFHYKKNNSIKGDENYSKDKGENPDDKRAHIRI